MTDAPSPAPRIVPVILSGGSGTRLWPLSRRERPKQFLPLIGTRTLLQQTAARIADPRSYEPPVIVCGARHGAPIVAQLTGDGAPGAVLLEPVGRNTAPAAAVAALHASRKHPGAVVALLPADHHIAEQAPFAAAMADAARAAADGHLVTFGIRPTRPETGYGYIKAGPPLPGLAAVRVAAFVEKPGFATAEAFLAEGGYFWNSGMFVFRADAFLAELARLQPRILEAASEALDRAERTEHGLLLDPVAFGGAPNLSIDHAVMEHTDAAAMVAGDFGWSDIGSWSALWAASGCDPAGNAVSGTAIALGATGSLVRQIDGPLLAVAGVEDMIVVGTADAVLVIPKARDQEVKGLLEELRRRAREDLL